MWSSEVTNMIIAGIGETLYMTLVSTIAGYIIGLPMGIVLTVTDKDGIRPNALVYKILDVIVNIVRSIPFIILLVLLIPFTRLLVGKSYGSTATIVPLVVAAAPYIARMVESSLKEVDAGVIEAARSMGASDFRIITKVLLVEARTSLLVGAIAIRYGYTRWQTDIMIVTVVLLVVLFQIFQTIGMMLANKFDHRK